MTLTDPLRYDTQADVSRRLYNTFILYKGQPVYVSNVSELQISVVKFDPPLSDQKDPDMLWVHSSDVDIDLESPRLGWCNIEVRQAIRPCYFLRTVNRQYSQGVDIRKTNWIDATKDSESLIPGYPWRKWSQLNSIADMMLNKNYPSIAQASSIALGSAFDSGWALVPTKSDNYRTIFSDFQPVGYFDRGQQRFVFKKGSLTKTRHMSLEKIFNNLVNRNSIYVVDEANT